jgi:hypothetical protein
LARHRIAESLRIFTQTEVSPETLRRFLEAQVTEGTLTAAGGAYRLA